MNKKIALTGVAAAVMSVVPMASVFAASSQTDTVKVTVDEACDMTVTSEGVGTAVTIANGASNTAIPGSKFTITCNDAKGWDLNAVGGDGQDEAETTMTGAAGGTAIATGTTLDGSVSAWAMKLSGTGVVTGFDAWHAVPGEVTKAATSAVPSAATAITATYGVGISATQAADTYTGQVTYTLVHPSVE